MAEITVCSWESAPVSVQLCALGTVLKHVSRPYRTVDPIAHYVRLIGASQDSFKRWSGLTTEKMTESLEYYKKHGFIDYKDGWVLTPAGSIVYENLCKLYE